MVSIRDHACRLEQVMEQVMTTLTAGPQVIDAHDLRLPALATGDDLLGHAARCGRLLPGHVYDALVGFADRAPDAGALLLRGIDVGPLAPTPASPSEHAGAGTTEVILLTVARVLGHPVGYAPEHGGDVVQNICPVRAAADRQVSTSSKVVLQWHTETAFHPHKPHYLLLLCLRGDENAATTLSSVHEILPLLDAATIATLFEPRFRIGVDESFLAPGAPRRLGAPMAVLTGDPARPSFTYDQDLMVGIDVAAQDALDALGAAVQAAHRSVVLAAGDLLVVDNHVAVHGRSPFTPRFDGTDRWLQRAFVVSDLSASAGERVGRVITTTFS